MTFCVVACSCRLQEHALLQLRSYQSWKADEFTTEHAVVISVLLRTSRDAKEASEQTSCSAHVLLPRRQNLGQRLN